MICIYGGNTFKLETLFSIFFLSAVTNRCKYLQNACFRDIVFKIVSEVIRVVSNSVKLARSTLFSQLSLQFQNIISNSVRMDNLTVNVIKIIRWNSKIHILPSRIVKNLYDMCHMGLSPPYDENLRRTWVKWCNFTAN